MALPIPPSRDEIEFLVSCFSIAELRLGAVKQELLRDTIDPEVLNDRFLRLKSYLSDSIISPLSTFVSRV